MLFRLMGFSNPSDLISIQKLNHEDLMAPHGSIVSADPCENQAEDSIAHDGTRMFPVRCVINARVARIPTHNGGIHAKVHIRKSQGFCG